MVFPKHERQLSALMIYSAASIKKHAFPGFVSAATASVRRAEIQVLALDARNVGFSEPLKLGHNLSATRIFDNSHITTSNMRVVVTPLRQVLCRRTFSSSIRHPSESTSVPRVASVWQSVIPKAFRKPNDPVSIAEREKAQAMKSKEWNPATFFIVIALLIGSNAIQMIALRNERVGFTRKTEAKIALLRETIERVHRGEDVDVERVLGTGDSEKEKEWDQVMQELESDNTLWKKKAAREPQQQEEAQPEAREAPAIETCKMVSQNPTSDPQPAARRPGFF
jgi:hypothetical protein